MDTTTALPSTLLATGIVLLVFVAIGFLTALIAIGIGLYFEEEVVSKLPRNQWMTIAEATVYAQRSRFVCTMAITSIENDIENEPLPGTTPKQRENIRRDGLEFWNIHLQRFRLIKGGRIRKEKRSITGTARLLWRPAHA